MKRYQAISIVFLLLSSAAIAQQVRVYGGGNLSTVRYVWNISNDTLVSSPRANFHYGASYTIQYAEHASFELGLELGGSSFRIKSKDQSIDLWHVKADLRTFSLPMALRISTPIGNNLRGSPSVFAMLGTKLSYIFDADYTLISATPDPDNLGNNNDKHTELNYAVVLGTGIEFSNLEISLKYTIGLTDIYNDTDINEGIYSISSWSLNVAYIVGK